MRERGLACVSFGVRLVWRASRLWVSFGAREVLTRSGGRSGSPLGIARCCRQALPGTRLCHARLAL